MNDKTDNINKRLHEAMGRHVCRDFSLGVCVKCRQSTWPNGVPVPDYCTDLNAAFSLVEWMREKGVAFEIAGGRYFSDWLVTLTTIDDSYNQLEYSEEGESLPTAISLAADKALGGE